VAIGIASSLILIVVMKIASVLQNLLWQRLPGTLGIAQDSPLWIIGVLTLTGIAVGLVIRFSQGHAGPDPACEPLIGAPVPPSALPGLIVALILGLAGGVSLGPEHPIMTVNIALAVAIGARLLPRVNRMEWTILASAGTIGALFGTPVAAALIFSQTLNGSSEVPLWDRLFAPLMAAAAGALTTGLFFHPHFSLPIAHYGQMEMTDILSGAIVAAIAIAAGMVAVWCLPRLHAMMHQMKNPVLVLGIGGFILGILGVIGGPVSLFKGLDEMQQMVANQAFSTSDYFLLAVIARTWELEKDEVISPLPVYASTFEGWDSPERRTFPLQLFGFHYKSRTHSTYGNIDLLKAACRQEVWINPIDAQKRGIANGDMVRVFNHRGEV
ncbi:ion channel protein, partial [Escherichia sp. HC-TM1]